MKIFRIEVPLSVNEANFSAFLLDNPSLFRGALNSRAKDHDPRSEVDTIRIIDVHVDLQQAIIHYEVDFCFRHGCQDLVHSDTHRRQVTARREGRSFVFEVDSPTEARSTENEF
jgi:hypothetical protein